MDNQMLCPVSCALNQLVVIEPASPTGKVNFHFGK
jgi:hypothetical protein